MKSELIAKSQSIMSGKDSSEMCRLYLIRHGETEWNVQGRIQGHHDSPLTQKGLSQASQAAELFKNHRFAAAFSSDLLRARRTGEIIAAEHDLLVESTQALREKSYGKFAGERFDHFQQRMKQELSEFKKLSQEERFRRSFHPDLESDELVTKRALHFLRQVALAYLGQDVLVTTHRGILRNLLLILGLAKYEDVPGSAFENLAYLVVESDGIEFWVKETHGVNFVSVRERVFKVVAGIPRGKVMSYGQLAHEVGTGARAVGRILNGNNDPDNIPCHRVVKVDGSLASGYVFGGPDTQRKLLEAEGVKFKGGKVQVAAFVG